MNDYQAFIFLSYTFGLFMSFVQEDMTVDRVGNRTREGKDKEAGWTQTQAARWRANVTGYNLNY